MEIQYERIAEVQEEILWLSEAARVPVIWATQVPETLTKKGAPPHAECVMLNKGPHTVESVRLLAGIHERMKLHQEKKMAMLKKLSIAGLKPSRKQTNSFAIAAAP